MRYKTRFLGFVGLSWAWWRSLERLNFRSHCTVPCIYSNYLNFSEGICKLGKNQHLYLLEVNCQKWACTFACCLPWVIFLTSASTRNPKHCLSPSDPPVTFDSFQFLPIPISTNQLTTKSWETNYKLWVAASSSAAGLRLKLSRR